MRADPYRKDEAREDHLAKLNAMLAPLDDQLTERFSLPERPVVFVIGAPRSGSTLVSQLLARSGLLGYVNNFTARYWLAPYIGAQSAQAFVGNTGPTAHELESRYGVTEGWDEPHEFGYFWNHYFKLTDSHRVDDEAKIDRSGLGRKLAGLEEIQGKPLFFKSLLCSFQIGLLNRLLPQARFVVCKRDPLYQAQSLLAGRREIFGSETHWFSLQPPGWQEWLELPPEEQVVRQIAETHRLIDEQLATLGSDQHTTLSYEAFCEDPREGLDRILQLAEISDDETRRVALAKVSPSLSNNNKPGPDKEQLAQLGRLCDAYFS